jgi:hypothetical protein
MFSLKNHRSRVLVALGLAALILPISSAQPASAVVSPLTWKDGTTADKTWPSIAYGTAVKLEFAGCQDATQSLVVSRFWIDTPNPPFTFVPPVKTGAENASFTVTPPLGHSEYLIVCRTGAAEQARLLMNFDTTRPATPQSSEYRSVVPARLLDSRAGGDTIDKRFLGMGTLAAGSTTQLDVGGRPGVPSDAKAVSLNVTVVGARTDGYVTVYPCGADAPNASNLNYLPGQIIPNAVTTKLGTGGKVCLFTSGATDLLVDVNGFFPASSTYLPLVPARVLDTRIGGDTVDDLAKELGVLPRGNVFQLLVGDRGGVPFSAKSVMLNVTVPGAAEGGYVTVFPCGSPQPDASNLNYSAGQIIPNMVVATMGVNGRICFFTSGATDLIVDVNGYVPVEAPFVPTVPARMLDTRSAGNTVDGTNKGSGPIASGAVYELTIVGRTITKSPISVVPNGTNTVMLNVTVVDAKADGYLTVFPCGGNPPNASNLNYVRGSIIPNAVIAQLSTDGKVCIFASGSTDVLVDFGGYLIG